MPASRRGWVFVATLAAACLLGSPAWAASSCADPGTAYAGLTSARRPHGIMARITALAAPRVAAGDVSAWVGLARLEKSKGAWIRVGLRATPGSPIKLFYQVDKPTRQRTALIRNVAPGERVRVAVIEIHTRPGWWRVWANRRPVSNPIRLRVPTRYWRPVATAESRKDGQSECNVFVYRFGRVSLARTLGGSWRQLAPGYVMQDPGYQVLRGTTAFVSRNRAPRSGPAPDFVGGWESGTWSPWDGVQHRTDGVLEDQFRLVTSPARQGRYAARFEVRPGDRLGTSSGERVEAVWLDSDETEGQSYWYAWSTLFPTTWTEPNGWGIFLQWHSGYPVSPPLSFNARGDSVLLNVNTGKLTGNRGTFSGGLPLLDSLNKGRWNDFIVHVRWSLTDGEIAVWHRVAGATDWALVKHLEHIPTLQTENGETSKNYLKHGLYRGDDTKTNVLYEDAFRRGKSLAAIAPELAADPRFFF